MAWPTTHVQLSRPWPLAARLCKACTLKLHYFEKFLAQNLQHQAGAVQQGQQAMQEPVAALMTGLHIAEIYMVGRVGGFQQEARSYACN